MGKGGQSINGVAKEAKPFEQENMAAWLVDVNTIKILPFELPSIVMEGAIIAKCTFESNTLLIPIFNHTKFKDIAEQICSRFVGLSPEVMELTYSLGDHQSCLLQSDMDVSVMKISCCAENIAFIPVSVSMVEPVEQLDPISSPHDKQIFTYEGIKPSDDRANLGKFATPHGKTYLSHVWRNYISHVGQEFPSGVKKFRQRLMKYAVEKGFRYVYARNDNERVTTECFNKDDEGCVWRVHAILNRPSRLFYIKSLNNVHTCKARFRDQKSIKMGSKIMASVLVDEIRTNPIVRPIDVVRDFKKNYGIAISYYNAWYGKKIAKMKVHGDDTQSYRHLLWYAEAVLATNPGSHVQLKYNDSSCQFERLFISYNASIEGFKFCRPFLCLDGTFIKYKYKGHLLVAIGENGNQGMI